MHPSPIDIVSHTPSWVVLVFAYLMYAGLTGLRQRVRSIGQTMLAPTVFVAWGLYGLLHAAGDFTAVATAWIVAAATGGALAAAMPGGLALAADREQGRVLLPGSLVPLLRMLVVFGAHYALNVAAGLQPLQRAALQQADVYVSGASAGYFAVWALRLARSYRRAPAAQLRGRDG